MMIVVLMSSHNFYGFVLLDDQGFVVMLNYEIVWDFKFGCIFLIGCFLSVFLRFLRLLLGN